MTVTVDVQYAPDILAARSKPSSVPVAKLFRAWVRAAFILLRRRRDAQVSLRIVGEAESAQLNKTYRHKRGSTNVLSFPAELGPDAPEPLLGDVVICAPVVAREAEVQHKTAQAHWAHMTIHGTLHLLGYDHIKTTEAQAMEALEIKILASLGFPDPYYTEEIHQ